MLQILPQTKILTPDTNNPTEAVKYINSHIEKHSCEHLSVDISFMNVLDACYVSTLCATKHFAKYPNGKISWKLSSNLVREFNKSLELGNIDYL